MNAIIHPSKVSGEITAPPSKSYSHRAVIAAALSQGISTVSGYLRCDDTRITLEALRKMGVSIISNGNKLTVAGRGGLFRLPEKAVSIDAGNSGTSLRLLIAAAALTDGQVSIDGSSRLSMRPIGPLLKALNSAGIKTEYSGHLPVKITGGPIKSDGLIVDAAQSSQFLSALLLIAPYGIKPLSVSALNLSSSPYAGITIDVMKKFGVRVKKTGSVYEVPKKIYRPSGISIEGDYSSAAYFLAAGYVSGGKIKVQNLNPKSLQGDRIILKILKDLEKNSPRSFDMNKCPDLVPVVAVAAAFTKGITTLDDIAHLRHKESDRIASVINGLSAMGIASHFDGKSLTVSGGRPVGAEINTFNDHRIAMSFAVAAVSARGPTEIKDARVVDKSYPGFWNDLRKIGTKLEFIN